MLVLTRKTQQKIQIGDNVTITILQVKGQSVRVGIEAPRNVRVLRAELPVDPTIGGSANVAQAADAQETMSNLSIGGPLGTRILQTRLTNVRGELNTRIVARRAPDVGTAPLIRYPNRLGPAALDVSFVPQS